MRNSTHPIDSLIKDIHSSGGDALLRDDQPLARRLCDTWPTVGRVDEQALRQLANDLVPLREELRATAEAGRVRDRTVLTAARSGCLK